MSAAAPRPLATAPLRIGLDGRALEPPRTGVGRYVWETARALDARLPPGARFVVYARRPVALPGPAPRWTMRVEPRAAARQLPAFAWLLACAGRLARADALDLFWATGTLRPRGLGRVPVVATVYDLNHRIVPQTMSPGLRLAHQLLLGRDLRAAAALVAISQGTAERVERAYGVRSAAVATPAVEAPFAPPSAGEVARVRARYALAGAPFFLAVATREPRKNLALLVRAFARARAQGGAAAACTLALAGATGWGMTRGDASADGVRALGYVPDADLPALYAAAEAFVFPSRYEGFGIPVLEARACGACVIASDTPEVREAGGDDVTYCAPNEAALARALEDAAAGRLARAAPARGALPTWAGAARRYAAVFEAIAQTAAR